jgi:hypothetical protein
MDRVLPTNRAFFPLQAQAHVPSCVVWRDTTVKVCMCVCAVAGYTVFASMWPAEAGGEVAWTIVNRGSIDVHGPQLVLAAADFAGLTFYDLVREAAR